MRADGIRFAAPRRGVTRVLHGCVLLLCALVPQARADAPSACPAAAAVVLRADPQRLDDGVSALFDPERRLRPEQLTGSPLCRDFRPIRGTPRFGYESRGIWLRFWLPPLPAGRPWRLLLPFSGLDRVCAHWPLAGGGYGSDCGDLRDPINQGAHTEQGWFFAAPAPMEPARPVLLYLEGTRRVLQFPLEFGTADAFVRTLRARLTGIMLLDGVLLAAVLAGLVLYADQRDRAYLYFSLYLGASLLFVATRENHFSSLGLAGVRANALLPLALALIVIGGTRAYQLLLQTRQQLPRLHRLLLVTMVVASVVDLSLYLPPGVLLPSRLRPLLLGGASVLWILSLLATLAARAVQGSRPALYLLPVVLVLHGSGLARSLAVLGLPLVDPRLVEGTYHLGQLIAITFLAVALLEHLRGLRRERDTAQALALSNRQLAVYRAHYDPVTHLPNRAKFRDSLQERLTEAPGQPLALVSFGLDRFEALTVAFGHHVGDAVLGEIATRLQQALAPGELLARSGGDVFVWLTAATADAAGEAWLRRRCGVLQQRLAAPLECAGGATLSASAGLARYPAHAGSAEQLLQSSEAALQRARARGPGQFAGYEPLLQHQALQLLELNSAFQRALEQGELALHYQPIVSLASGELMGVESLARWQRADGRAVPPDQFLPVAEGSELLRRFTEWGLRSFGRQLADWRARALPIPYASFNLSAPQLRLDGIETLIAEVLQQGGNAGPAFVLEITEGTLLENLEATRAMLVRLKPQGLAVAIDDFGVGYASPHYLRMLPVDILKLDGVFLRGVPEDAEASSVLDSLITLGRSLKLKIVTECVETAAQAQHLGSRGVHGGQGYWFSRALPAPELERWLLRRAA